MHKMSILKHLCLMILSINWKEITASPSPTKAPSDEPTASPTPSPTSPTKTPSNAPSNAPTPPTKAPSDAPSSAPTPKHKSQWELFLSEFLFKYGKIPPLVAAGIFVLVILCICVCCCRTMYEDEDDEEIETDDYDEHGEYFEEEDELIDHHSIAVPDFGNNFTHSDFMVLSFKTNKSVIPVYNERLFQRMMGIDGFYYKVHDYNIVLISHKAAQMTFVLRQSSSTVMANHVMHDVMLFLENEHEVTDVSLVADENDYGKERVQEKYHRVSAIIISFVFKSENVEYYADELIHELENMEYFFYNMYEYELKIINPKQAKFQLIVFCSEKRENDPQILDAMDSLSERREIRKLKADVVPYFVDTPPY